MLKFGDVKLGSKGQDVIVLQSCFRTSGAVGSNGKPIDVDGVAGNNTVKAINDFRACAKAYGCKIDGKDGVFNKSCWDVLFGG